MTAFCALASLCTTFSQEIKNEEKENSIPLELKTTEGVDNQLNSNNISEIVVDPIPLPSSIWLQNGTNIYYNGGNVGIGTSSPSQKLHINGNIRGNQTGGALRIQTSYGYTDIGPKNSSYAHFVTDMSYFYFNKGLKVNSGNIGSYDEDLKLMTGGTTRVTIAKSDGDVTLNSGVLKLKNNSSIFIGTPYGKGIRFHYYNNTHAYIDFDENLYFRAGGSTTCPLILERNGNVTIGKVPGYDSGDTHSQGYKLLVNGNILCEGIDVVKDVPYSDFVFKEDYKLRSIDELEEFVSQHNHLPEIPSAKEFKENGYNIGEMDDLLLRKVEELTLYIIQLENRISELESK